MWNDFFNITLKCYTMKQILKNNSLSIVFFILFLISIVGQMITGLKEHNSEMQEKGGQQVAMGE